MEHALPRTWSLCMTSENHGTVGPAGCTFSHAPEKHERVLVVEVRAASTVLTDDEDLLDVVRTLCAVAARRGELVPERLKHYPHVDEEGSPVLVAARAACVARGYTEDGLSVEGVIYPVAAQAGQVAVPEAWSDKIKAAMKESQVGHNYDGNKLVWKLEELLAAPSPAKESK